MLLALHPVDHPPARPPATPRSVLQREADLRFALVRVRENAESVAFYEGGQREGASARARLDAAVATHFGKVAWESWLSLFRWAGSEGGEIG